MTALIVGGDRHLLELGQFGEMTILTPRDAAPALLAAGAFA